MGMSAIVIRGSQSRYVLRPLCLLLLGALRPYCFEMPSHECNRFRKRKSPVQRQIKLLN